MEWLAGMWFVVFMSLLPTVLSVLLGGYWLKNERFPWEKKERDPLNSFEDETQENTEPDYERGEKIG